MTRGEDDAADRIAMQRLHQIRYRLLLDVDSIRDDGDEILFGSEAAFERSNILRRARQQNALAKFTTRGPTANDRNDHAFFDQQDPGSESDEEQRKSAVHERQTQED